MQLDKEKYRHNLKTLNLTKEKEDEILYCVWNIMNEFVSAAFGKHPVQLAQKQSATKIAADSKIMLHFSQSQQHKNGG